MSWYRTYRPQTIAALHIAPVREAFLRILKSGEFHHAYLLVGPKGTGKTSGARILAKMLNCEKNRTALHAPKSAFVEPCNVCDTCTAITRGASLCVTEMDGASNRGIDDIRALTERIGLSAADGPISVIIIDEVHMLTTEAFNALLKVLEEPPTHVVFILATTDPQKMPATVISRCDLINYRKATIEEVSLALQEIAQQEVISVGEGVIERLAQYADGSFRDGVKIFEQVVAGKKNINLKDVEAVLGVSFARAVETLIQALAKKDYDAVVRVFTSLDQSNVDMANIQKGVLTSLHSRLVAAPAANSPHLSTYIALLKSLNLPLAPLLPFPALPFEMACLEWCLTKNDQRPIINDQHNESPVTSHESQTTNKQIDFPGILDKWHVVLREVRAQNSSMEALLRTATPKMVENNVLTVVVTYKFHKDQLASNKNMTALESVLKSIFGAAVKVNFVLEEGAPAKAENWDMDTVRAAEEALL